MSLLNILFLSLNNYVFIFHLVWICVAIRSCFIVLNKWITHYLHNRTQKVFVNGSFSDSKIITAGVPQGSVLGPLLFLVYVNDIADSLLSTTRLFADDSLLAVSSCDINFIETTLNEDLETISKMVQTVVGPV